MKASWFVGKRRLSLWTFQTGKGQKNKKAEKRTHFVDYNREQIQENYKKTNVHKSQRRTVYSLLFA